MNAHLISRVSLTVEMAADYIELRSNVPLSGRPTRPDRRQQCHHVFALAPQLHVRRGPLQRKSGASILENRQPFGVCYAKVVLAHEYICNGAHVGGAVDNANDCGRCALCDSCLHGCYEFGIPAI